MLNRRRLVAGLGAAALAPLGARAQAAWPNKPIKIVVGYPAGGLTDGLARAYGDYIGSRVGQSVVVENRSGASGMLAGAEVAKAAPDGYTFWFTITGSMAQNQVLFKKMPYDPNKDFVHVSGFDSGPLPLCVLATSPIKSFKDLVDLAKRDRITLGNYAQGSYPHMLAQQLTSRYGAKVEPVPYRGEAPMWVDLLGGQITAAQGSVLGAMPHIQSGRLRPIAVSSPVRSAHLPDVPTFVEQGFTEPVFSIQGWLGMFAPAGTPADIVKRVSDLIQEGAATPRVQQLNKTFGLSAKPWSNVEFERIEREMRPQWIGLAKELNITLD